MTQMVVKANIILPGRYVGLMYYGGVWLLKIGLLPEGRLVVCFSAWHETFQFYRGEYRANNICT